MRKIVAGLFSSLDGVVEAPETWHFPYLNEEMNAVIADGMRDADTVLLGRATYDIFAGYWPNHTGEDQAFADQINNIAKVVVSSTLQTADWKNTTVINTDAAARVAELKRQPGKNISTIGSTTLVRWLLREGLLDELGLLVHPIVVGSGARLFEDGGDRQPLELVSSTTFSNGVMHLVYRPA